MASNYNGIPDTIASNLPTSKAITSSSATNPVVITTSTAHGMLSGDYTRIERHGNPLLNGFWPVSVITPTTYSIPTSAVVTGSGGTSTSQALGPAYQIPGDGDADVAASVNAAFEALGDRTAFLELKQATRPRDLAVTVPGASWRPLHLVAETGSTAIMSAAWDPHRSEWIFGVGNSSGSGSCDVVRSVGLETNDFTSVSGGTISAGGVVTSVLYDGSHYFAAFVKHSDSSISVYRCSPGGAWSQVFTDNTFVYSTGNLAVFDGQITLFAANPTLMSVFTSTVGDGASGHWGGPTGAAQNSGPQIFFATNGTLGVAFPNVAGPTHYMTGTDPTASWTTRNASFLVAGDTPTGLVYSAADGCFILTTAAADAKARTYTSTDGVSWGLVNTWALGAGGGLNQLAVTDSGCVVAVYNDGAGYIWPVYSTDAGFSWRKAPAKFLLDGFALLSTPGIAASPAGFVMFDGLGCRFSTCEGGLSVVLGP